MRQKIDISEFYLKTCPFCGNPPEGIVFGSTTDDREHLQFTVGCQQSDCEISPFATFYGPFLDDGQRVNDRGLDTNEKAIKACVDAWNRRQ